MPDTQSQHAPQRYVLFDGLRGLTMVSMILYHFCYDLFVVEGLAPDWPFLPVVHLWQQSICCTFIALSGFCWEWGHRGNLRRGLWLNACGLGITAVTAIAMPGQIVLFGVLNFIGCAILLTIPVDRLLRRIPALAGAVGALVLFAFTKNIQWGSVGLFGWRLTVPAGLYTPLLTVFGFPAPGFWSSDFFPIFPWIFLFWLGYFLHRIFTQSRQNKDWAKVFLPIFSHFGKWSLWVYLVHQPICFAVAMLLARIL